MLIINDLSAGLKMASKSQRSLEAIKPAIVMLRWRLINNPSIAGFSPGVRKNLTNAAMRLCDTTDIASVLNNGDLVGDVRRQLHQVSLLDRSVLVGFWKAVINLAVLYKATLLESKARCEDYGDHHIYVCLGDMVLLLERFIATASEILK